MTTPALVSAVYKKSQANISEFRKIVNRPLTLSEKILIGHLVGIDKTEPGSGIRAFYNRTESLYKMLLGK